MSDLACPAAPFRAFRRAQPLLADARATLRTLRDLLRWAVSRFEETGLAWGHGTDNSRDEAAWLLLWSLHLPPDDLESWLDCRLSASEIAAALVLVERRCTERVPAAWLTGEAWLRGLGGSLDEWLIDWLAGKSLAWAAEPGEESPGWTAQPGDKSMDRGAGPGGESIGWGAQPREESSDQPGVSSADVMPRWPARVLDLCTGGGSLAILAALHFPHTKVTGSDISAEALALAAENVALHGLRDRIDLLQGDLFDTLPGSRFDLILCNPPYVNAASMAGLPPEFRAEPVIALAGGVDGMDFIARLLAAAGEHLSEHGVLVIEIGHEAGHFKAAFPGLEYAWLPVAAGSRMIAAVTREAMTRDAMTPEARTREATSPEAASHETPVERREERT